jgi:hypothetical protein
MNLEAERFNEGLNFSNLVDLHTLNLSGCELEQFSIVGLRITITTLFPLNLRVLMMNDFRCFMGLQICQSIQVLSNLKVLELSHAMFDKGHWEIVLTNKSRYVRSFEQMYSAYMNTVNIHVCCT